MIIAKILVNKFYSLKSIKFSLFIVENFDGNRYFSKNANLWSFNKGHNSLLS